MTLGINFNGVNEIDHLEDDQTHIYVDYDHISNLIQEGTSVVPKLENAFMYCLLDLCII